MAMNKKKKKELTFKIMEDIRKQANLVRHFELSHPGTEFEFFPYRQEVIFWCNGKQKRMSMPFTTFQTRWMIVKAEFFMWRCEDNGKLL